MTSLAAKSGSESSLSEECEKQLTESKKADLENQVQKKMPDIQVEEKEKCSDEEDGKIKDDNQPQPVVRRRRSSARNNAQVHDSFLINEFMY